jgi:hypothetical protein
MTYQFRTGARPLLDVSHFASSLKGWRPSKAVPAFPHALEKFIARQYLKCRMAIFCRATMRTQRSRSAAGALGGK